MSEPNREETMRHAELAAEIATQAAQNFSSRTGDALNLNSVAEAAIAATVAADVTGPKAHVDGRSLHKIGEMNKISPEQHGLVFD